ncbi:DUF551 domain-containing protein [Enterobacter roggenkampii]|uniref:DUF551 domain-containing protein n=1 Tax=Enterobacter roggenkampii TaxID=1812935 RepID=UPI003D6FAF18
MSTITKQAVQAVADLKAGYTLGHADVAILNELARIALASLETEAVADVVAWSSPNEERTCDVRLRRHDINAGPLYTAPPAPVSVPDKWTIADAVRFCKETGRQEAGAAMDAWNACRAAMLQGADGKPELTVWYGSMPESNGKANWTAILHRKGEGRCMDGFTIDRSEYPGRVLYAADRVRYLIGEKSERPSILDYDADAHSGYMKTGNSPVIPDCWVACSERMPEQFKAILVFNEYGEVWSGAYDRYWNFYCDNELVECVTHWMPLPAAPQQEVK